ncbi:ankyrin repeat-containing protein [Hypsugopox virus]|nr:ankyrin repeat-containing protein [Hypsugopox virus]
MANIEGIDMFSYLESKHVTIDGVKHYLDNGCNPNDVTNMFKNNALHYYFYNEHDIDIDVVKLLLEYGTNIHHKNWRKCSPLKEYSRRKQINSSIVILLLEATNYENINEFDIHTYVTSQYIDTNLLKILIEKNINLCLDKNNRTLFENYVKTNNPNLDILNILIKNDFNYRHYHYQVSDNEYEYDNDEYDDDNWYDNDYQKNNTYNFDFKTALHLYIITHCYTKISKSVIQCLIDNKIPTTTEDVNGCTPLQYYIKSKSIDLEIINMLMFSCDACYSYRDMFGNVRGVLVDYCNDVYRYDKNINIDVVKLLLKSGTPYNIMKIVSYYWYINKNVVEIILKSSEHLQEILHLYLKFDINVCTQLIDYMIEMGALIELATQEYFKNKNISLHVLDFLLEKNNNVVNQPDDENELSVGQMFKHLDEDNLYEAVKHCLVYIKDINTKNSKGETLLFYAIRYNKVKIAKFIIEHGAKTDIVLKNGTYLSYCININNSVEIFKLLIAKKPNIDYMIQTFNKIIYYDNVYEIMECIKYIASLDIKSLKQLPNNIQQKFRKYIDVYTNC